MRKLTKTLALTGVLVTGFATASTLQALDTRGSGNSTVDQGIMNRGGMMKEMSQMMDSCSQMMGGGDVTRRPNDQWRKDSPAKPQKDG